VIRGGLTLPADGTELWYFDANCYIYTVERVEPYLTKLAPIWDLAKEQRIQIITSELTLMEVLVKAFKLGDSLLEGTYRALLQASPDSTLTPITLPILERAARLRATTVGLKTPDAIHAATALEVGATQFLTNDAGFRSVTNLPVTLLDDLLAP
jgi:predicted nucleic acid-binding protein